MVNAPTRRPPGHPGNRRPPKGPRLVAGSLRPTLVETVSFLKEHGQHDKAHAVEAVLGPRGYLLLQRSEEGETSPISLTVNADLGQALRAAAEEFEVVLDGLAEEAYRKVLDRGWIPLETGRGKGGTKSTVQVQVDLGLRREVQAILPRLKEQAGYKVTESNIILSHICEELGIERPNSAKAESLQMRFPKSLVDHWNRQAESRGVTLEEVVEGRIPSLVDGSWTPTVNAYVADPKSRPKVADASRPGISVWASASGRKWSESERVRLWLPIDKDLLTDLREKADALSDETGQLIYPGSVVRAILTDELGEPAE